MIATERGLGVELWGTASDLKNIYGFISEKSLEENENGRIKYAGDIDAIENRTELLSGFLYEIRKAFEGERSKREHSHFSFDNEIYYGCKISWVHFLFSLVAVKNIKKEVPFFSKWELSLILQMEYWLESAMGEYDTLGAKQLQNYVSGFAGGPFPYQIMRNINSQYFLLGGGKKAFRELPFLMRQGLQGTDDYKRLLQYLTDEAKRLKCRVQDLEVSDDHINYDVEW